VAGSVAGTGAVVACVNTTTGGIVFECVNQPKTSRPQAFAANILLATLLVGAGTAIGGASTVTGLDVGNYFYSVFFQRVARSIASVVFPIGTPHTRATDAHLEGGAISPQSVLWMFQLVTNCTFERRQRHLHRLWNVHNLSIRHSAFRVAEWTTESVKVLGGGRSQPSSPSSPAHLLQ
jgi:hypothetical protein